MFEVVSKGDEGKEETFRGKKKKTSTLGLTYLWDFLRVELFSPGPLLNSWQLWRPREGPGGTERAGSWQSLRPSRS